MTPLRIYIKESIVLEAESRLRQKTIIHPYRIRVNNQMFEFDGYLREDNTYFECKFINNEACLGRLLVTAWRLTNVLSFIDDSHNHKNSRLCIIIITPKYLIDVVYKYCQEHLRQLNKIEYKVVEDPIG